MPGTVTMFTQVVKKKNQRVSACLFVHDTVETCGGVEIQLSTFFSSTLDVGECSASRLGQSNPGGRTAFSHWVGYREMGLTILLDFFREYKNRLPPPTGNRTRFIGHQTRTLLSVQIFSGCVEAGCLYSNRCDVRLFLQALPPDLDLG